MGNSAYSKMLNNSHWASKLWKKTHEVQIGCEIKFWICGYVMILSWHVGIVPVFVFSRISTLVFNRCYSRKKICQVWLSWSLLIRPGSHVRGDFAKTLWGRPRQRGGSVRLAHLEGQMKIVRTLSLKNASIYIHRSESRWRNSQKVA